MNQYATIDTSANQRQSLLNQSSTPQNHVRNSSADIQLNGGLRNSADISAERFQPVAIAQGQQP